MKNSFFRYLSVICLIWLCAGSVNAQFSDDFSDGDFSSSPAWQGEMEKFVVDNGKLRLSDQSASGSGSFKAYLSTSSKASISAEWSFRFEANLNLTGSNYARFYVLSDQSDLKASLIGYYVQVGSSNKDVCLYMQEGTKTTKLIDGTDSRLSSSANDIEVKLTRDAGWNFTLWTKKSGESEFVKEGEVVNNQVQNGSYSGVYINFSSSNKDKYFFDDFRVTGSPYIYVPQVTERHSVVISEILVDPEPQAGLPKYEFVELYNRTDETIDISGWQISVGKTNGAILAGTIQPHSYIILCDSKEAATAYADFGNVASLKSLPSISNTEGLIALKNAEGDVVTWTEYSQKWFGQESFKKDGGFSLERIDLDNLHNSAENWKPCQSNVGGTPGAENTVKGLKQDMQQPEMRYYALAGENTCLVLFSKEMSMADLLSESNFVSTSEISRLLPQEPKLDRILLEFSEPFDEDTVEVDVRGLHCVSGLPLSDMKIRIARPDSVLAADVVINEILYNPAEKISEFVELYNRSHKVINLADLVLTTRKSDGALDTRKLIASDSILLFPSQYLLLSSDINSVCSYYECGDGLKVSASIPSLPNSEGDLVLCKQNGDVIDELVYSDKMQSPAVINSKGVSLERVNPDRPTQDKYNWTSAAFADNYATPARINSQYNIEPFAESDKNFWFEYETFTPDQDGYRDFLLIHYQLPEEGYSMSVTIYTPNGVEVKRLLRNEIAGIEGTISWAGDNDSGSLSMVGVYVIKIEAFKDGKKLNDTKVCVLSMK